MTDPTFLFELPAQASPEQRAITELAKILDTLRGSVAHLAEAHVSLQEHVDALGAASTGWAPAGFCWRSLDRDAARELWAWLMAWTRWLVDRYGLAQDLGACWPAHPPLVEELTALCVSWHHAYSGKADPDAPLRWHEALHRARQRWQAWDTSRCRFGEHGPRSKDAVWSDGWPTDADRAVKHDVNGRPAPQTPAQPVGSDT